MCAVTGRLLLSQRLILGGADLRSRQVHVVHRPYMVVVVWDSKTMPGLSRLKSMKRFRDRDLCWAVRRPGFVRAEIFQCGGVFSVHETESQGTSIRLSR